MSDTSSIEDKPQKKVTKRRVTKNKKDESTPSTEKNKKPTTSKKGKDKLPQNNIIQKGEDSKEELIISTTDIVVECEEEEEEESQTDKIVIVIDNPYKAQKFETLFQHIKLFSKDININITENLFYIQCMDSAKVSIFELKIPSFWFDKWIVPKNCTIGISTTLFYNIIHLRENRIRFEYDYNNSSDKLSIELIGEKCKINYELPLMDIECDILEIPEQEYSVDINMNSTFFFGIINKLKLFGGNNIDIECREDNIFLYANTLEAGKMSVNIKIDDLTAFAISEGLNIKTSFAINYIYNISLFHKVSDNIELHIIYDCPLKIVYYLENNIDDNEGIVPQIIFYLAPKCDDNDD